MRTVRAPRLSDKELVALVQNAKTPADHETRAGYYERTAAELAKGHQTQGSRRSIPAFATRAIQLQAV